MPVTRRVVRHQFSVPAAPPAPWSPLSLPSLVAWYKGDAGVTDAGAGAVSAWADQSGNGRHLTQATGANRPTTGTRQINGINGLDFDGTTDFMTATYTAITQPNTVLIVVSVDTTSGVRVLYDSNDAANRNLTWISTPFWHLYAGNVINTTVSASTGDQHVVTIFNGASSKLYVTGTQIGTTHDPGAQSMGGLTVGRDTSTNYFDGIIAEVVVMNAAISASDQTEWNTYCARWGL